MTESEVRIGAYFRIQLPRCASVRRLTRVNKAASDARSMIRIELLEGRTMYAHLLVPTDGSKLSDKAVAHAIELARVMNGRITAFYASPEAPSAMYAEGVMYPTMSRSEYAKSTQAAAGRIFDRVVKKAAASGVDCATVHVIGASPWEAILAAAKKSKCDAIVMASHGRRGLSALLLGSETVKVLTHGKLPVLVVK